MSGLGRAAGVVLLLAACRNDARQSAGAPPAPVAAPSAPPAAIAQVDAVEVSGHRIELTDRRLTLETPGEQRRVETLESLAPCRLHRDSKGKVRTATVGQATVVLVECSAETMRSADGKRRLCDTRIHGVVVSAGEAALSARTQSVAMCPPFEWDDHLFAFFVGDPRANRGRP